MTPTLLLIHGWGYDPGFWDALRTALPDFRTEAADLGYFGAPYMPTILGSMLVVGHSTGALLALREPLTACIGLVAINGFDHFVSLDHSPGVPPRVLDRMIARLPADPVGTVAEFRRRCGDDSDVPPANAERLGEHLTLLRTADERSRAAAWALPLMHLSGAQDPILPPELRTRAFAGGPGRVAVEHPQGGHLLPVTHPAWCAAQLRALVEAL